MQIIFNRIRQIVNATVCRFFYVGIKSRIIWGLIVPYYKRRITGVGYGDKAKYKIRGSERP